jgi:hypothetical protein
VDLHSDAKEKTAFSTGQGLWQFTVMPFGLCNAAATFGRLMDTVLRGLTYESCLVCLDNVIVIPRAPAQPAESVPAVPRSQPNAQSGEVPTLSEGSTVPSAHCAI